MIAMSQDTDLVKQKVDLVDFLKSYLSLVPAGKNFKALCPFHQEKTPSFFVSPEKKMWHCFGCGLGGDVIKFAMLYEHIEFPEALKFLAEKAGLEIRTLNPAEQREFGVLYDLNDTAKKFYRSYLLKNEKALSYLRGRGLKDETMEEFSLGYAPGGEELTRFLIKGGFNVNDVVRAGLTQKNVRGLFWDKFQKRIMFPIENQVGKTVAFTGRILPDGSGADQKDIPKYLNSDASIIFNKSKTLYGFDKSKGEIAETKTVIIVEGQMDLLMLWQSGFKNVVAVSGTGLTKEHLERLRRFTDTVMVSFDKDAAGIKALERSLEHFHNFDFHVKVIDLGNFKDPADACQKDPELMRQAVDAAKPALLYLMDIYFSDASYRDGDIPVKKRVLRHILSQIGAVQSAVEKGMWISACSRLSGVPENDLREELNNLNEEEARNVTAEFMNAIEQLNKQEGIAKKLVTIALTKTEFLDKLKGEITFIPDSLKKIVESGAHADDTALLELEASYIADAMDEKTIRKEFNDLLTKLKVLAIKETKSSLKKALQEAERKGDESDIAKILEQFSEESKKLNDLKK